MTSSSGLVEGYRDDSDRALDFPFTHSGAAVRCTHWVTFKARTCSREQNAKSGTSVGSTATEWNEIAHKCLQARIEAVQMSRFCLILPLMSDKGYVWLRQLNMIAGVIALRGNGGIEMIGNCVVCYNARIGHIMGNCALLYLRSRSNLNTTPCVKCYLKHGSDLSVGQKNIFISHAWVNSPEIKA